MMTALVFGLLLGLFSQTARAEDSLVPKKTKIATAHTNARVLKGVELQPDIFAEAKAHPNQVPPDISTHSCDAKTRRLVENCIQMILEIP